MLTRLEALADAIGKLNGMDDPESRAYRLRNPLLLRAYSLSRAQAQDAEGHREFDSLISGYRAGLCDLQQKCAGCNRAKLKGSDPLEALLGALGHGLNGVEYQVGNAPHDLGEKAKRGNPAAVRNVVLFLRRALDDADERICGRTPLGYFLGKQEKSDPG